MKKAPEEVLKDTVWFVVLAPSYSLQSNILLPQWLDILTATSVFSVATSSHFVQLYPTPSNHFVQKGEVLEGWRNFYKACGDPLCLLVRSVRSTVRRLHGHCAQQVAIPLWSKTLSGQQSPGSEAEFKLFWVPFVPGLTWFHCWGNKEAST